MLAAGGVTYAKKVVSMHRKSDKIRGEDLRFTGCSEYSCFMFYVTYTGCTKQEMVQHVHDCFSKDVSNPKASFRRQLKYSQKNEAYVTYTTKTNKEVMDDLIESTQKPPDRPDHYWRAMKPYCYKIYVTYNRVYFTAHHGLIDGHTFVTYGRKIGFFDYTPPKYTLPKLKYRPLITEGMMVVAGVKASKLVFNQGGIADRQHWKDIRFTKRRMITISIPQLRKYKNIFKVSLNTLGAAIIMQGLYVATGSTQLNMAMPVAVESKLKVNNQYSCVVATVKAHPNLETVAKTTQRKLKDSMIMVPSCFFSTAFGAGGTFSKLYQNIDFVYSALPLDDGSGVYCGKARITEANLNLYFHTAPVYVCAGSINGKIYCSVSINHKNADHMLNCIEHSITDFNAW